MLLRPWLSSLVPRRSPLRPGRQSRRARIREACTWRTGRRFPGLRTRPPSPARRSRSQAPKFAVKCLGASGGYTLPSAPIKYEFKGDAQGRQGEWYIHLAARRHRRVLHREGHLLARDEVVHREAVVRRQVPGHLDDQGQEGLTALYGTGRGATPLTRPVGSSIVTALLGPRAPRLAARRASRSPTSSRSARWSRFTVPRPSTVPDILL